MFCCRESDRAPVDRLPMDNEVDETFMDLALEVSKKSPDSNTKVPLICINCDRYTYHRI